MMRHQSPTRWMLCCAAMLVAVPVLSTAETYTVHRAKPVEGWDGRVVDVKEVFEREEDPFAKVLKAQPGFADQVKMIRRAVEWSLGGELSFAAKICEASKEQRLQMKSLAQQEIKAQLVDAAKQMEQQFGLGGRIRQPEKSKDQVTVRHKATKRILLAVLWPDWEMNQPIPDNLQEWEEEFQARVEYRHRTNATLVTNILGNRLLLSPDQYPVLVDAITPVWKSDWEYYIQIMELNPQFFPPLPDKCLKPHLTEEQFGFWQEMPKQQIHGGGWQIGMQNFFVDHNRRNEWFDDVAVPQVPVPERPRRPPADGVVLEVAEGEVDEVFGIVDPKEAVEDVGIAIEVNEAAAQAASELLDGSDVKEGNEDE